MKNNCNFFQLGHGKLRRLVGCKLRRLVGCKLHRLVGGKLNRLVSGKLHMLVGGKLRGRILGPCLHNSQTMPSFGIVSNTLCTIRAMPSNFAQVLMIFDMPRWVGRDIAFGHMPQ